MGRVPSISTERLVLRPRTVDDFDSCLAMDAEPGVTRFITGPWDDPATHRAFVMERMRTERDPGLGYWVVTLADDPEGFLGWVLLIDEDDVGPEVEIGWRLRPAAQGRGLASEAAGAVLHHGLSTLGLPRVVAEIDLANTASLRVAAKLGMVETQRSAGPRGPSVRMVARGPAAAGGGHS